MMSASHPSARPRRALLAELGDALWLSYYRLIGRRSRLDGFVLRPVHTIDLATLDGHRLTLPVRQKQVEMRRLSLHGHIPDQARRSPA